MIQEIIQVFNMQTRSLEERSAVTDDHLGHSHSHHTRIECPDTTERAKLSESVTNIMTWGRRTTGTDKALVSVPEIIKTVIVSSHWIEVAQEKVWNREEVCTHTLSLIKSQSLSPNLSFPGSWPTLFAFCCFLFCLDYRVFVLHGTGDQN